MKNNVSFEDIETHSYKVEENELFIQYSNVEIPDRYDSNYLLLKFSPILEEFKLIEEIQLSYQQSVNQQHLKFIWPENTGVHPEVLEYFDKHNYQIGMQNLYWVTKDTFSVHKVNPDLTIRVVDDANFKDFLTINLKEDLKHGKAFHQLKERIYPYQYQLRNTRFLLAYLDEEPVGSLIIIHSDDFLEVDNVLTDSDYRGQCVATSLLYEVVHHIAEKNQKVILVADAEDTPKDMYEKMGFKYMAYQISAQKNL